MGQLIDAVKQLKLATSKLPDVANKLAVDAAKLIIEDLALHTPVDVGTAVSNWQVSIGFPASEDLPAFSPSRKGTKISGRWQHSISPDITRQNNAVLVINTANEVLATKQPGIDIFITNNLPYISILNQGSSEQAPAGFADRALILAESIVDKGLNLG